jgi:hypothetical protein
MAGKMKNVAAGFSLRQHRLESLCHQEFPDGWICFSGSQAPAWEPNWRQSSCFAVMG